MPNDDPDWANSVLQGIRILGQVQANGGVLASNTFPALLGMQGVGYIWDHNTGNVGPSQVTVQGTTTLTNYLSDANPVLGMHGAICGDRVEASLKLSVTPPAASNSLVYLVAYFGSVMTLISPAMEGPLNVTFAGGLGGFTATPAPWQAPLSTIVVDGSGFGAGVTLHLVAGTANQAIYVFGYRFRSDSAVLSSPLLQSTGGSRVDADHTSTADAECCEGNGGGRSLPVGEGLDIVQQGAAATNLYGHVHYTKQ